MEPLDDESTAAGPSSRREEANKQKDHPDKPLAECQQVAGDGAGSGSFDCNICLELAQDPVVTLCGHLFCWPCIYRWLKIHCVSKECPVCKASVVEEKVIPLYGRGKIGSADPRTKPVPGVNIPHRPAGQRPDTARPAGNQQTPRGSNLMGGYASRMGTGPFGNITFSAGFGLFPSLFGLQMHGFQENGIFSGGHGSVYGAAGGIQGNNTRAHQPRRSNQEQEILLHRLFLFLACFVFACLLLF